ncbi:hypothetical protein [Rhizobium rhizogenes]|uniref:hypothetical protein n=1 Tax=Rhizobium rhizogenes TaxID=359 RepID=UPI00226D6D26|nr:hypothetical protein [Rhizobium rhizogenes]
MKTIWVRGEVNPNERRSPLTPDDAASLIRQGYEVHVETAPKRVFSDSEYQQRGCIIEPRDSWRRQRDDAVTLGIKLPELTEDPLFGEHVFYAHQYTKTRILHEKPTARKMLDGFSRGGGTHYDTEFLTDETGAQVSAFSTVAGGVGTVLAIVLWSEIEGPAKTTPKRLFTAPTRMDELKGQARSGLGHCSRPSVALLGARGHCGIGAAAVLNELEIPYATFSRQALLDPRIDQDLSGYDIIVNCMAVDESTPKFLNPANIGPDSKIRIISDIGCETNNNNPILLRGRLSSIDEPFYEVSTNGRPVYVIAIDHLPAITPLESSQAFSAQMTPLLLSLLGGGDKSPPWVNAQSVFLRALSL